MVNAYIKRIIVMCAVVSLSLNAANPINPGAPVQITNEGEVEYVPVVTATTEGSMVIYADTDEFFTQFSTNNGSSWLIPGSVSSAIYAFPWVSGRSNGDGAYTYMALFNGATPGMSNSVAFSISTDEGAIWSDFTFPSFDLFNQQNFPVVSSNKDGFMIAFNDNQDAYAAFTNDNGVTWRLSTLTTGHAILGSAVFVSGSDAGFMVTWTDADNNACATFSSNDGVTWTDQVLISTNSNADVCIAGYGTGFMATWITNTGEAYSRLATIIDDLPVWGSPVLIASNILTTPVTDAFISASNLGFVVTWIDVDSHAYASFTTGSGEYTWSPGVVITTSIVTDFGPDNALLNVNCFGEGCIFAWLGDDSNVYTIYSRLPALIQPPTQLTGLQVKNNFGIMYELCNTLQWQLSVSTNVAGYSVYANGNVIATVSASTYQYQDHSQTAGTTTNYAIKAFDAEGDLSAAATVAIG